jgi:putative cell wall-binding protein
MAVATSALPCLHGASSAPRLHGRSRLTWVLVLVVALVSGAERVGATEDGDGGAAESLMHSLIDAERAANGLGQLRVMEDLEAVARRWSQDMASRGELEHNPLVADEVCCWQRVAENVGTAWPPDGDATERLHRRFMESEYHRANVLHPHMSEVGIGVARTDTALWVTVIFREPDAFALGQPAPAVERAGGSDRADTAAAISRQTFATAETVIVARAQSYPDALAGAALAGVLDAPILLAGTHGLPSATAAEIERLGARRAVLLGGRSALGWGVVHQLRLAGVRAVERIEGPDRFETAASIAREVGGTHVYLVEGAHADATRGWPDALSVASLSAHTRRPVLLLTRDEVPPATLLALADLGATRATVVGGAGAVSEAVLAVLRGAGLEVDRVAGATRYGTSSAVADLAIAEGLSSASVWLATGRDWPDALTAGPAAARRGDVLMLVDGHDPAGAPATHDWLTGRRGQVSAAWLVGGPSAITDDVAATVALSIAQDG